MKFLKHKLRDVPPENTWYTMQKPKNVFYKNASMDFLRAMNSRFHLSVSSGYDTYDDNGTNFYYSNSNEGSYNIVFCIGQDSNPETIELTLISEFTPPDELFKENDLIYAAKDYAQVYKKHRDSVKTVASNKRNYISSLEQFEKTLAELSGFGRRQKLLKGLGIVNYLKIFEFNNVVAEDTCCDGEDIELGTLKFQVDFQKSTVKLIDGSNYRSTPWGNTFHPHDLGSDGICLGSQSADMAEAIKNLEVDIIQVMLYKFAHSYTSSDSAGANWKKWTSEFEEEVYSDYHGEDIPMSEAVQLYNGDWIRQEDSVILRDGRRYPRGWTNWSEYYDEYIDEDTSVWSSHLNSYIEEEDDYTIQLLNGDWSVSDHDEVFEYDGNYYLEDETIEDINGNIVPKRLVVYSQVLQQHILSTEAIMRDGEYYTQDTLPETLTEGTIG